MTEMKSTAVIVFARTPRAGQVKTRLIPALGECGAMYLHQQLVRQTLDTVAQLAGADCHCYVTPQIDHAFFRQCAGEFRLQYHLQQGEDLGQRMHHAIAECLQNYDYVLLVGTDCPELTVNDLHEVQKALQNGAEVVITPAVDGGYVLIAMKHDYPAIFSSVAWGTGQVLAQTLENIHQLKIPYQLLSAKHDIDTEADLPYCPDSLLKRAKEKNYEVAG